MSKGKCYPKQDILKKLFDYKGTVLEPACGNNAITVVLLKYFSEYKVYFSDIKYGGEYNFLDYKSPSGQPGQFHYIITNPPFSLANEFIIKAKQLCTVKFAFPMKLNYLQGQFRYENIFSVRDNFPLTKIYVFTRMPTLENTVREDGKYKTGMQAMAWYIWEKQKYECLSQPIIKWIDSKNHIVRKGE